MYVVNISGVEIGRERFGAEGQGVFFGAEVGDRGGHILLGDCTIGEYQRCRDEAAIVWG